MRLATTTSPRICIDCGEEFKITLDKPGRINQCAECGESTELDGEERLGGNMIYTGKQAPEIEIKPISRAQDFAGKTQRFGAGVTMSICESKGAAERSLFSKGQWMSTESLRKDG